MIRFLYFLAVTCGLSLSIRNAPGVYQLNSPIDHAETPTWDSRTGNLYFVNAYAGEIYRYTYKSEKLTSMKLNGEVGPVITSKNNSDIFIVGLNLSIVAVEWNAKSKPSQPKILSSVSSNLPNSKFNAGKADKKGRLWVGTTVQRGLDDTTVQNESALYKITRENLDRPEIEIAPINSSNGVAFNKANNELYFVDSSTTQVHEYKYNLNTGTISRPKVVFDVSKEKSVTGNPAGLTVDKAGNLWVALYGGGAVVKVNPRNKKILSVVPIPALYVTSVIWGGPKLDVLFVTTSKHELTDKQRQQQPGAGSVFAVLGLKTKGLDSLPVDIDTADEN